MGSLKTLRLYLHLLSACIVAFPASGASIASTNRLDAAFGLIRKAVEKDEIPGAIALVAQKGRILRHEALGWSDPVARVPFTTNTLCWIASLTKPVTTAAAMTLVDKGKLGLDDPVEKFLPEFKDQTDEQGVHGVITVRHLMTHTSGLPPNPPTRRSGWPIGGPLDDSWLQKRLADIVRDIARAPLRFAPGSRVEYSNAAFFVLGRIIEVVSGRTYAEHVKQTILDPLGMQDTCYAPGASAAARVSPIYAEKDGERVPIFRFNPKLEIVNAAPDGGLFSYPADLARFVQAFLEDDSRILSRRAVTQMLEEQRPGRGLGWALESGMFFHEGSSGTLAWGDPKTGVIGILFFQFRDQKDSVSRLRKEFRDAVQSAIQP
jgi:CubicO group peptidase (beta-lactamase class C family)